jgi:hypothetical protein
MRLNGEVLLLLLLFTLLLFDSALPTHFPNRFPCCAAALPPAESCSVAGGAWIRKTAREFGGCTAGSAG